VYWEFSVENLHKNPPLRVALTVAGKLWKNPRQEAKNQKGLSLSLIVTENRKAWK